jgi:hypothetical protein
MEDELAETPAKEGHNPLVARLVLSLKRPQTFI